MLIRNLSQDELDALDVLASKSGVSRAEYVRDRLRAEARRARAEPVTREDLDRVATLAADLLDDEVMAAAWR
jgi:hypothetical protein